MAGSPDARSFRYQARAPFSMASRQRLVASASSGDGLGMEASPSDCKKPGSSSGDSSMRARLMRASWNRSNGPVSIPWSLRRFSSFLISSSYSFVPGLGRSSFFSQSGRRKPTCMCGRLVQYQSLCTVSTATHPPGSVVSPDGGANGAPGPAPASSNGSGMHSNIGSASGLSRSSASSTQSSMSSGSTSSSSPSRPSNSSVSVSRESQSSSPPTSSSSSSSSPSPTSSGTNSGSSPGSSSANHDSS
ncbi:MAG: hypothetical protein BWY99_01700 [Synergistetes bacterium ADurb.BinA166]|nr:MAG: hypothetical protein BWY99_01700 [Synergistetes bacterium ADurb.BinA166]